MRVAPATRSLPRPRLETQIRSPLTVLAAPRGYGKTTLLEQYAATRRAQGRTTLRYTCVPDDRRVVTLGYNLTRMIMRGTQQRLFEGPESMYASGQNVSPLGLGRAIGDDLSVYTQPLDLLVDAVDSPEVLECLLELAGTCTAPNFSLVISGTPILTDHVPAHVPRLTAEDLAFTPAEAAALGLPDNPYGGWPAPTTLALHGKGQPEAYAAQLVQSLDDADHVLLSAALLDPWTPTTPRTHLQALDLPSDYVRRLARLGWPVLHASDDDTIRIPHLLRDAMLAELEQQDRLGTYRSRLADVLQETHPIRALELRTEGGDQAGALAVIRAQLPQWVHEHNWNTIDLNLTRLFGLLGAEERLILAQAKNELASSQSDLSLALTVALGAQEKGAKDPAASLLIASILGRMGRLNHAIKHQERALQTLGVGTAAYLNACGWLSLCYVDLGNSAQALIELSRAGLTTHADPDETPMAYVAAAAAHLHQGQIQQARSAATQAYLAYTGTPEHLYADPRAGLRLMSLLTDLDEPTRAAQLFALLPTHLPQSRWYVITQRLWQAQAALRGHALADDALELLHSAAEEAGRSVLHALELQARIQACLVHLHRHEYPAARKALEEVSRAGHSDPYLELVISDLKRILRVCTAPAGIAPPTLGATMYPRETSLILARATGATPNLEQYGAAVVRTWRNWSPLPLQSVKSLPVTLDVEDAPPVAASAIKLELRVLGTPQATLQGHPLKLSPRALALLLKLADGKEHVVSELAATMFRDSKNPKGYASVTMNAIKAEIQRITAVENVLRSTPGVYAFMPHVQVTTDLLALDTCPVEQLCAVYRGELGVTGEWMFTTPQAVRERVSARLNTAPQGQRVRERLRRVDPLFP